jgi:hypothetical protein
MGARLSKFVREFTESSRSSKRTDCLFGAALLFQFSPMLFQRTPSGIFVACMITGSLLFIAAVVSLAIDNHQASKMVETKSESRKGLT